ncbi:MAG: glyoxalase/bleomycin resistance/dioxygenase family protein [Roseiflexaceae bacterium]
MQHAGNGVAIYQTVLGYQLAQQDPGFVLLQGATNALILVTMPAELAAEIDITVPPAIREETPIKPLFVVGSIAAARQQAALLGGAIRPVEQEWQFGSFRVCDGYDPEGNIFQLREEPA